MLEGIAEIILVINGRKWVLLVYHVLAMENPLS